MSLIEMKATIDFFSRLRIKTMTILGGEPLLYPHLEELVSYAIGKGITSWIVTNGTELCKGNKGHRLVDAGVLGGCISLFSMEEGIHESITGKPGSFRLVQESLLMTIRENWPFYPMITIGDQPFENTFRDVVRLVKLGFTKVYINYGIPNVFESDQPQYATNPQFLADSTHRLYSMQAEYNVRFVFNCEKNKVPICHFDSDIFEALNLNHQIGFGCEMIQGNTIVVEPGGSVLGCSHWVGIPLMNIYKDYSSLSLLSEDEFFQEWEMGYPSRVRAMINQYPYEKCALCALRASGKCFGGCKTPLARLISK
jgi:radical SAM protein with 4Fe4S-binding SPASM domain